MRLYEIIIEPFSGFATPLKGDTIFGSFCWQAARERAILNGGLEPWIACYDERPAVIFSSAWPCFLDNGKRVYALKRPDLPPSVLFSDKGSSLRDRMLNRKDNLKRTWMRVAEGLEFNLDQAVYLNDQDLSNLAATQSSHVTGDLMGFTSGPYCINFDQPHNSVNRHSMTTGVGFAPYSTASRHYYPETELAIFVLVDEEAADIEHIVTAVERIGQTGFGADASIGCGRFGIVNYEELGLPASAQANAAYVLSPVIPQSDVFTDQFFRPFIRYGRHGDQLATSASPFKNPVIMADEGAVFVPTDPKVLDKPYLGRAVSGISKAMPATVHQGYAIHIPFRLELNYA